MYSLIQSAIVSVNQLKLVIACFRWIWELADNPEVDKIGNKFNIKLNRNTCASAKTLFLFRPAFRTHRELG